MKRLASFFIGHLAETLLDLAVTMAAMLSAMAFGWPGILAGACGMLALSILRQMLNLPDKVFLDKVDNELEVTTQEA